MDRVHFLPFRFRCNRLDRELSFGFDPNHDPDRRRRARELTDEKHRRDLAQKLGELIGEAAGSPHWQRPERWAAIREASPQLSALAQTLAGSTVVSAQGIARIGFVINDGMSPLYGPDRGDELLPVIGAAVASLELGPMVEPRRDWARSRNRASIPHLRAVRTRAHL